MSLAVWAENGWLKPHKTSRSEVVGLLAAAARDLDDAGPGISAGWRFAIGYTSALRLCSVVLHISGYRASREQKHYRTIMALPLVFGSDILELAEFFDRCRVKRHAVTYESVTAISNAEADDLVKAVGELRETVGVWLQERHPNLVP